MRHVHELGRDLRYAARGLRREPAFVAGVVLTFALTIGANAALFGLVERLMLAPPSGVLDAARVVRIGLTFDADDGDAFTSSTTSYPAFQAIAALGPTLGAVAAVRTDTMTTGRGAELAEVAVVQASGRYFGVLGARPALGRFFGPGDDELPHGGDVVVLGHAYWQRRFGADAGALGRRLLVDGHELTIVGVAPRGFNGHELAPADLYIPLTTAAREQGPGWWSRADVRMLGVLARLRDGVEAEAAGAMIVATLRAGAVGRMSDRLRAASLETLVPGRHARRSPQARVALWLSGVSLVVLLVATANVGTLLLLRAARRRRDTAVRIALGAARGRLARQALAESVVLALVGCGAGLVLSGWISDLVRVTLLPTIAEAERVVNGRVLLVSIGAATGAGLLAGVAPLVALWRRTPAAELRAGGDHGSSGRFVAQRALVALQAALSAVLLVGAGLFVRSLDRVRTQDLGFSTARLLHVTLDFRDALRGPERDAAHEDAVRRLHSLRGVTHVTVVQGMPFSSHHIPPIHVPGHADPPNVGGQIPILYGATPAYLELMGVTLLEGRLFTDRDDARAPLVVLVNETMARTVWPGERVIGKCVRAGHAGLPGEVDPMAGAAMLPCRSVVGVVRDSRARSLRLEGSEARLMQYYVPFPQLPKAPFPNVPEVHAILVGTASAPERLAPAVQRLIQGTSAVPVYARVRPYQTLLDPQLRSWRLGARLFSALGALALGIAAVGLFAVVSYLVAQRTREIGVRLALGGTGGRVARAVVWDAVRMAGGGAAAGLLVAVLAAPLVQPMLFQTSAREPAVLIGGAVLQLAVTMCAAAVPAWRASRVSAMIALRADD